MGVALPRLSGWPKMPEKIQELFIDHGLHDDEEILKKYPTLIFAKKWVWPCHALKGGRKF